LFQTKGLINDEDLVGLSAFLKMDGYSRRQVRDKIDILNGFLFGFFPLPYYSRK